MLDYNFVTSAKKGAVHDMVRRVLKPGQIGVDVGAAVGEIVDVMRECVGPLGQVVAIEPRETDIKGEPNVVHRVVCGATTRPVAKVFLSSQPTNSSLFRAAVPDATDETPKLRVPMERLDDLVLTADLVKLDVQGAEVDVIMGAPELLKICPAWILEVWPYGLQTAGRSLGDLMGLMFQAGLTPHGVDGGAILDSDAYDWLMQTRSPMNHTNWLWRR